MGFLTRLSRLDDSEGCLVIRALLFDLGGTLLEHGPVDDEQLASPEASALRKMRGGRATLRGGLPQPLMLGSDGAEITRYPGGRTPDHHFLRPRRTRYTTREAYQDEQPTLGVSDAPAQLGYPSFQLLSQFLKLVIEGRLVSSGPHQLDVGLIAPKCSPARGSSQS